MFEYRRQKDKVRWKGRKQIIVDPDVFSEMIQNLISYEPTALVESFTSLMEVPVGNYVYDTRYNGAPDYFSGLWIDDDIWDEVTDVLLRTMYPEHVSILEDVKPKTWIDEMWKIYMKDLAAIRKKYRIDISNVQS